MITYNKPSPFEVNGMNGVPMGTVAAAIGRVCPPVLGGDITTGQDVVMIGNRNRYRSLLGDLDSRLRDKLVWLARNQVTESAQLLPKRPQAVIVTEFEDHSDPDFWKTIFGKNDTLFHVPRLAVLGTDALNDFGVNHARFAFNAGATEFFPLPINNSAVVSWLLGPN